MEKNREKSTEYEEKVASGSYIDEEASELNDAEAQLPEETAQLNDSEEDSSEESDTNGSKLPPNVEAVKSKWWPKYLITAGVLAVFVVLVAWARGAFTETDPKELLVKWCDAFSVPGILALCFGLLIVASNGGTFDMLAYGFKSIFRLLKKDPVDRKYGGFYEYRKARQQQKRSFWYLFIVGAVYMLVAVALLVAYLVLYP